jgi:CRP-like cAMP-binding protein
MSSALSGTTEAGRLAGTWFGARLPATALAALEDRVRFASFGPGVEILREGELTQELGIVSRGRVALRLRVPERGPTTILTVEAGDILGWSAVIPPHRATSTAVTLVPTDLLLLDGESLRASLAEDPALAAAVYGALLEALARRLTATRQQLLDLFTQPMYEPW